MTDKSKRLASVDALRGFDMLLIAGEGSFIYHLLEASGWSWADTVLIQMKHVEWNGFTFWDFILPRNFCFQVYMVLHQKNGILLLKVLAA